MPMQEIPLTPAVPQLYRGPNTTFCVEVAEEVFLDSEGSTLAEVHSTLLSKNPALVVANTGVFGLPDTQICEPVYRIIYSAVVSGFPRYVTEWEVPTNTKFRASDSSVFYVLEAIREVRVDDPIKFRGMENGRAYIKINSKHLGRALASITGSRYSATGEWWREIDEPYPSVVNHLDHLRQYAHTHSHAEDLDITLKHIDVLLRFIDTTLGKDLGTEALLKEETPPKVTYKWLWTIFEKGVMLYSPSKDQAYVLESITGGGLSSSTTTTTARTARKVLFKALDSRATPDLSGDNHELSYTVKAWRLSTRDDHCYRRTSETFIINTFSGAVAVDSLPIFPVHRAGDVGKYIYERLVERGRKTQRFLMEAPCHKEYDGWSLDPHARMIRSRVMIDPKFYEQEIGAGQSAPYEDAIVPIGKLQELDDLYLALLSNYLMGWVLNDRRWCMLHVDSIDDFVPNKDVFDNLILPDNRTELIKALVQSHILEETSRRGGTPESSGFVSNAIFAADAMKPKGQGLLVLLHGPPGVGKTYTAECVAEYTGRPLFPVTCGDLGTEPRELEDNLQNCFRLAQRWHCVMLLDEADVFLARRYFGDLKRSSLVSVFLRVLEYYNGILFLTTNRVGSFDEAFTSRLHVGIYYSPLKDSERSRLWQYHINRLEELRPDINISGSVFGYLESDDVKTFPFNGRQIRNIFQMAVSLAASEAETAAAAPKKRTALRSDHFRKAIGLSTGLQEYLQQTRNPDSQRARDEEIRNDEYEPYRPGDAY